MNPARLISLCVAIACVPIALADGDGTLVAQYDPVQHWEVDYESGLIWRVTGSATPLSYTILPQLITVKSPLVGTVRPFFGGDLVMRNRFSLLVEPIAMGPEHHFIGASASGIMEWWDKRRTRSLFFAEDFNLNWLAYPGVRFLFKNRLSVSAGIYFQHISNHNMNSVNPGLNAVGPMLSLGRHF
jgi:hypothetical protein